jgi:hypothetical protein
MRSRLPTCAMARLAAMMALTAPLLVTTSAPASAAAPANDEINSATGITSLPFRDRLDPSLTTWDFSTDSSECHADQQHSVWYSLTLANDGPIAFDPSQSEGTAAVDVFTGSPGALTHVGCGYGGDGWSRGLILGLTAGTTYWIMASSTWLGDEVTAIDLSIYPAVLPQATVDVTGGTFDRRGDAIITGTLDCVGIVPGSVTVQGFVRQDVGRLSTVSATFSTTTTCDRQVAWTALARPEVGKFAGGRTTVDVWAPTCNVVGCAYPVMTEEILLRHSAR